MTADEIKALRKELGCTARELADTLGTEVAIVRAWESEERFPTKKWVTAMQTLREKGRDAVRRKPKSKKATGLAALRQPLVWDIVCKLAAHPDFLEEVAKLAADYDEPNEGS